MSSPSREAETSTVPLTRSERWVVHHVLAIRVDEVLESDEAPPEWLYGLFDRVESGDSRFTLHQARKLHDALLDYATEDGTPGRDIDVARTVADRLDEALPDP